MEELGDHRRKSLVSLDKYGRMLHRFSALLSQTEQELGPTKFDLPSASHQFRGMMRQESSLEAGGEGHEPH